MRKIVIRKPAHIAPFNEPVRALRVLNKPLWQWQQDVLSPYCDEQILVDDPRAAPRDVIETLIVSESLWFDIEFFHAFLTEARRRRKPARAAVPHDDASFTQQGLRNITRSVSQRADLLYLDLWYFPEGIVDQVEALLIPSEPKTVPYHHNMNLLASTGQAKDAVWHLPTRGVLPIDSWVHLFYANIIFGVMAGAARLEGSESKSLMDMVNRRPANVKMGKNCKVDPSATLVGPVEIGDDVTIGPGCVVSHSVIGSRVALVHGNHINNCVISDDCFLPASANATYSAYMEGSTSGSGCSVSYSVVGRNTVIGPGTQFTDTNLLPIPLKTTVGQMLVEVPMPRLGACIGHNCRIGAGLIVYPGRMVESDVVLLASPTRRVIAKNISYEESDHHFIRGGDLHARRYPRDDEYSVPAMSPE